MGISGVNPVQGSQIALPRIQLPGAASAAGSLAGTNTAGQLAGNSGASALGGGSSIMALSSTSIQASTESLIATNNMPMLSSNEALGAALLLLVLQYLQSSDPTEKQGLLDVILTLAGSQQQGGGGGGGGSMMMYNSSSLSIESTQLVMIGSPESMGAYSGASATAQQAPQIDPGAAAQLDIVA